MLDNNTTDDKKDYTAKDAEKAEKSLETGDVSEVNAADKTKRKKNKKKKKGAKILTAVLITVAALLVLLAAGLAATFFVMRSVGKNSFTPTVIDPEKVVEMEIEEVEILDNGKSVTWKGEKYVYNENIVSVAFMGVDEFDLDAGDGGEKSAGQSDTNMVMAFDTSSGEVTMLVIPRDTMVDVDIYDDSGNFAGIQKKQLCLSYAYGDGKETSCENTVTSMERLLCGIDISNYAALDLKGIGSLNNAVGGVEIVCLESIGEFVEGETYHLWDEAARDYVQRRDTTKFNSDAMRRERQLQYAKAFAKKAVEACLADFGTVTKLYDAATEYSCTDISLSQFTYLASTVLENKNVSFDNIYVLEGEAVMGDKFMEVHVDAEKVLETVLAVFYTRVEE